MASSSTFLVSNGGLSLQTRHSLSIPHSASRIFRWQPGSDQDVHFVSHRTQGQQFRVLANPNRGSNKEVLMVDPLEAKRLAVKQMQEIKAKERRKRQREIEAINGAWAIIGLTAGLVIEGNTGKGILSQLEGYWEAIIHIFPINISSA